VATWSWPTWVVCRRRVLEAVFILLELLSPSRRTFIGSHSLPPPSLVRRFGPSRGATYHAFLFCGTRTHLVRWEWFSHGGSRFDRFDTMDRSFDRRGRMDVANPTFEEMARH
jgi:hypothetical protein